MDSKESTPIEYDYGSTQAFTRTTTLSHFKRKALLITVTALSLLLIILAGVWLVGVKDKLPSASQNPSDYNLTSLKLNGLRSSYLDVRTADSLTVNGALKVNSSFVLSPTKPPDKPVIGQLYFDKDVRAPFYYDGNVFVNLAPSVVPNINGATGAITLTGTANQVLITHVSANAFTFGTPQSINTTATPTFGGLRLSSPLTVDSGGTGGNNLASNGMLYGNGTGAIQATQAAANSVLVTDAMNLPRLSQALPFVVQGNITTTGVLIGGAIAKGFGAISTSNDITTTAVIQAGSLSLTGTSFNGTINVSAGLGQTTNYQLPDPGQASVNLCLSTGNCAGAGGGVVTAGGTSGRLAKFTGTATVGNSILDESSSTITLQTGAGLATIQGSNALTLTAAAGSTTTLGSTIGASTLNLQSGTGGVRVAGSLMPATDLTYDLGASGVRWHEIRARYAQLDDPAGTSAFGGNSLTSNTLAVLTGQDSKVGLVVKATNSTQSADLFQLQNSNGTVLTKFDASGGLTLQYGINATPFSMTQAGVSTILKFGDGTGYNFALKANNTDILSVSDSNNTAININRPISVTTGQTVGIFTNGTGSTQPITILKQGHFINTSDFMQMQDSTGASLQRVDVSGNLETVGYYNNGIGGIGQFANLLTYSEQFDNTAWVKTNVAAPTPDTIVAPNGQTSAESLADLAAGGSVAQTSGVSPTNTNYTFSVWLKTTSGTQTGQLRMDGSTSGTGNAVAFTATTTWQRFSVTQNTNGFTGNIKVVILPGGSTGSGIVNAWGAQLVMAASSQVYASTTASTVTASSGVVSNNGLFRPSVDSATVLQVQNAAGTTYLGVDTNGGNINVNANLVLTAGVIRSGVADGASAVAFTFNSNVAYTTSGAKLLSLQNNGSEKFAVDKDGNIITASVSAASVQNGAILSSGIITGTGNLAPPTNTHTAVPGLATTVTVTSPTQILVARLSMDTTPSANTVSCVLTIDGVEQARTLINSGSNELVQDRDYRVTGLAVGSHNLAANCWSTSAVGTVTGTNSQIYWELQHP